MRRSLLAAVVMILTGILSVQDAGAHGHHRHGHAYPGPYLAYPGYGFAFGFHFGYPYGPYPWGPAYWPGYVGVPAYPPPIGFVDLDVEPEEAEVHVGGAIAGIADNYDGFPDYLALRPGKRTLTFKHPGFQDLRIRVHVAPGMVIRIRRDMVPLPSSRSRAD